MNCGNEGVDVFGAAEEKLNGAGVEDGAVVIVGAELEVALRGLLKMDPVDGFAAVVTCGLLNSGFGVGADEDDVVCLGPNEKSDSFEPVVSACVLATGVEKEGVAWGAKAIDADVWGADDEVGDEVKLGKPKGDFCAWEVISVADVPPVVVETVGAVHENPGADGFDPPNPGFPNCVVVDV
jgi:hypothetical protein